MSRVKITETSLRDGHQSLMATRLTTAEILPIVGKMDRAGYYSLEVWGGATFDSAIRFLNEDPWERLREIRKRVKNTKLQMLLRGQNLLGYRHYADDIVDKFVEKSIKNGIDIIRTFDALNDVRNIRQASESTKKYGGHSQLAICYTISPVHTIESWTASCSSSTAVCSSPRRTSRASTSSFPTSPPSSIASTTSSPWS